LPSFFPSFFSIVMVSHLTHSSPCFFRLRGLDSNQVPFPSGIPSGFPPLYFDEFFVRGVNLDFLGDGRQFFPASLVLVLFFPSISLRRPTWFPPLVLLFPHAASTYNLLFLFTSCCLHHAESPVDRDLAQFRNPGVSPFPFQNVSQLQARLGASPIPGFCPSYSSRDLASGPCGRLRQCSTDRSARLPGFSFPLDTSASRSDWMTWLLSPRSLLQFLQSLRAFF